MLARLRGAMLLVIALAAGGCRTQPGKTPVELRWQWPENRLAPHKIVVVVKEIRAWGGGPLGVGRSPSLPTGFADPIEVRADVLFHQSGWSAESVELVMPAEELRALHVGDRAALALIADG